MIIKTLFVYFTVLLLCFVPATINAINYSGRNQTVFSNRIIPFQGRNDETIYIPQNITPTNASYHPSSDRFTIEWWYFEGIFDNGYNAVVNIILWSRNHIGLCITHLNIFHVDDSDEFFTTRTVRSMQRFNGSTSYPDISIDGEQLINFDRDAFEKSDEWIYTVTVELEGNAVDLRFVGRSQGWVGNTLGGFYGPVLPMADVTGTIKINNKQINVSGLGYHEHAHGISFPIKESGWYWGKIVGDNASFFWGKMMDTIIHEQGRAGVFSKTNEGFINIRPEYIHMEMSEYVFHQRRFIPTHFVFTVSDPEQNIFINVTMKTVDIYHLPFGIINYWRYVLSITGKIVYEDVVEELHDETQIMELMRFR